MPENSNNRKIVKVCAAVIVDETRTHVFATQRGYGDFKGGWEFPGGKMEVNESGEECIKREIREELNTEINVLKNIGTIEYDYDSFHLSMTCYLCMVSKGNLELSEHLSSTWLTKENIKSVNWLPADSEIIDRIKDELN